MTTPIQTNQLTSAPDDTIRKDNKGTGGSVVLSVQCLPYEVSQGLDDGREYDKDNMRKGDGLGKRTKITRITYKYDWECGECGWVTRNCNNQTHLKLLVRLHKRKCSC